MNRQKIRWAIGSSDSPRSRTWVLWENKKGEIYLATRSLGGTIKASFHRDGNCHVGFTSEYKATASRRFGVSKRHWEKWRLPDDQVVRVLQILVPHSELRVFADRNPTDDVTWLPMPSAGSIGIVSIFVSKPGIDRLVADVPDAFPHPIFVGSVRTSIRTAWVIYVHHPMDAIQLKMIDDERVKVVTRAAKFPPGARVNL